MAAAAVSGGIYLWLGLDCPFKTAVADMMYPDRPICPVVCSVKSILAVWALHLHNSYLACLLHHHC